MPLSYLTGDRREKEFKRDLSASKERYRGYNLLFGSPSGLYCFSNRAVGLIAVQPGVHGLSNAHLNSNWPKVTSGRKRLAAILQKKRISVDDIFALLADDQPAADSELPDTGIGIALERRLSPLFIRGEVTAPAVQPSSWSTATARSGCMKKTGLRSAAR